MGAAYYVFAIVPLGMFLIFFNRFFDIDLTQIDPKDKAQLYSSLIIKVVCLLMSSAFFLMLAGTLLAVAKADNMDPEFVTLAEGMLKLNNFFFFLVFLLWFFTQGYYLLFRPLKESMDEAQGYIEETGRTGRI